MKKKIIKGLKWFFFSFIWLAVVMLAIDIVTKLCVANASGVLNGTTPKGVIADLIPGFVRISYSENNKSAFGLGFNDPMVHRIIFIIVASCASIGICVYFGLKYKKLTNYVKAVLMLILAGAIGNWIDRLFYSFSNYCVVDWIDFYGIWPFVFNWADSCIVVGCIMLIVYLIVEEVRDYKAKKALEPKVEGKVLSVEEQRRKEEIEESKNSK